MAGKRTLAIFDNFRSRIGESWISHNMYGTSDQRRNRQGHADHLSPPSADMDLMVSQADGDTTDRYFYRQLFICDTRKFGVNLSGQSSGFLEQGCTLGIEELGIGIGLGVVSD